MSNFIKKIKEALKYSHTSQTAVFSLILANLISIVFAIYYRWQIQEAIVFFWSQNIIIGIFACFKLLFSKNIIFSKEEKDFKSNKKLSVIAFAIPFFLFNGFYLLFFKDFIDLRKIFNLILLPLGVFLLNHLISLFINFQKDFATPISYKQFTDSILVRILPIHLFIIFGGPLMLLLIIIIGVLDLIFGYELISESSALIVMTVIFMSLKAFFEVIAHILSHVDPQTFEKLKLSFSKKSKKVTNL